MTFALTLRCLIVLAILPAVLAFAVNAYALPSFNEVKESYRKSDAVLLDRHGKVIHELRIDPEGRRLDWVGLRDISPALKNAVIHSEDKRFYEHSGVDWNAVIAAGVRNIFSRTTRGASTITMQLATVLDKKLKPKNSKKTFGQKWKQILAARDIERAWTKDEIFETYLNLITFRGELQGISAASRGLFGKGPNGLDEPESLVLASLIRSPNAPAADVFKRACALGISVGSRAKCAEIKALAEKTMAAGYSIKPSSLLAPHLARALLHSVRTPVITTLDSDLQRFVSEVLRHHLSAVRSQNVSDGAVLVAENRTGEILAYVAGQGGESTANYVDGIKAKRQAGSTLKPFLYAAAFDNRILTPASIVNDGPTDVPTATGIYKPENYESDFKGMVSVRTALASSLNIPAVKVLSLTGVEHFVHKLRQLGFTRLEDEDYYGPSLALGSADVNLFELVNAYRTLANGGLRSELRVTFEKNAGRSRRVFSEEASFLVSSILSDREARSSTFSLENPLSTRFWSAVKTGTSKDMRDNWCVGYSQRYTVGVWVGNFNGAPMWNVSGVTGAAPVWLEIINYLQRDRPSFVPKMPPGVVEKKIAFADGAEGERVEWFIKGTEPATAKSGETALQTSMYSPSPRIIYPVKDEIIAVDPDIPGDQQVVFFEALPYPRPLKWLLDGKAAGDAGGAVSWRPVGGHHRLALVDAEGVLVDSVNFSVRGN